MHDLAQIADAVTLRVQPDATRFIFRGRAAAQQAIASAFGVALADICRAASSGDRSALWLGPDEWLLLAPAGAAQSIESALAGALADLPHSLVEVSERQIALALEGPKAAPLLRSGCPLDIEAMPVGMCTRTILAKAEIILWRTAPTRYHVEVWRSFEPYLRGYLEEAGREYGL